MPEKTGLKNVENMEKSKNEEHFIISVLKVGQGKKKFHHIKTFVTFFVLIQSKK